MNLIRPQLVLAKVVFIVLKYALALCIEGLKLFKEESFINFD